MKPIARYLTVALFVLLLGGIAAAQDSPPPPEYSTRVSVSVKADDALQSQVTSFLTRELRELQGVVVTDSELIG